MDWWHLNLRHLRAMEATTRLGSVSRSARAVGISQPAVTQALTRLERHLGVALFDRSSAGMAPTEAARLFAPRAARALDHIGSNRVTMPQMRALLAVAEGGGYAGGSLHSGLAQPTLHRTIGDLSLALGRTLVERRGRGTMLTEAGARTVRRFRLARNEMIAGLSEIGLLVGRETGRISVGAMPLARARILPMAVCAYYRHFPDMKVAIVEGSRAELVESLRDGDIDLMIGALRNPLPEPELVQQALFVDRPIVLGRYDHPLAGQSLDSAALARYPWAIAAPGTPLRTQWEAMFTAAGLTPPPVPIECGSVIAIRQILIGSDFLTLLSRDQVRVELEAGWLREIATAPVSIVRTVGVTMRADWRPTPRQRAFLADLHATCAT
jgi:DNA-binding transcriptional LysR family regulator